MAGVTLLSSLPLGATGFAGSSNLVPLIFVAFEMENRSACLCEFHLTLPLER